MKRILLLMVCFFSIIDFLSAQSDGDYRSSVTSGSWSATATWQRYNGTTWVAATDYPGQNPGTGEVTIQNDHTITLDVSPANPIFLLTIATGNKGSQLIISGQSLMVDQVVTINEPNGGSGIDKGIAIVAGGSLSCSQIIINRDANLTRSTGLRILNGDVTVFGDITMDNGGNYGSTNCSITFTTGTLTCGGTITGGNIVPGTGTVTYNRTGADLDFYGYNYHNLTLSGGFPDYQKTLATGGLPCVVTGKFLISGASGVISNADLTLTGGESAATCEIDNSGSKLAIVGTGNLLTTAGGGDENFVLAATGQVILKSATAALPTFQSYNVDPYCYVFFGCDCNQTINLPTSTGWGRFTVQGSGIKTLNANIALTNLRVFTGATLTIPASQQISISNPFGGSSEWHEFKIDGTFNPGTGKVIFNSTGFSTYPIKGAPTPITFYDLEINQTNDGSVRLDRDVNVSGTLTLTNGKINAQFYTLTLSNSTLATQLSGGSTSSYVYATGVGRLRRNGLNNNTNTLFPIGTSNYYLPVEISQPGVATADFAVNVFQGISTNGVEGGPQFSNKSSMVDAVWNIDKPAGSPIAAAVKINWVDALEGSGFSSLPDNQIGITRYSGGWGIPDAFLASQATNFASEFFSSFSPFAVGWRGTVLPLKLLSFDAATNNCTSDVEWKTTNEVDVDRFELQVSYDGQNWRTVYTTAATNDNSNENNYSYTYDHNAPSGNKLLRLKMIDKDGKYTYSKIIRVQCGKDNGFSIYPNPAQDRVTITGTNAGEIIRLVSMNGKALKIVNATQGNTQLSIEGLPSGTYLLQVLRNGLVVDAGKVQKK